MEVRADLAQIVISDTHDQQYIVLRERDGERYLPIVIGAPEAAAIERRVKGVQTERPLTHDLLASVIDALSATLEKVVVTNLHNSTFYAKLVLRSGNNLIEVDSRPSDAIALGVAGETPIYVEEQVLREAGRT